MTSSAAVFGYFELLVELKDPKKIEQEIGRLRAFTSDIEALGYDLNIISFAIDETFDFMENLHKGILEGKLPDGNNPMSFLLENFNDENTANCIIYYFKVCFHHPGDSSNLLLSTR